MNRYKLGVGIVSMLVVALKCKIIVNAYAFNCIISDGPPFERFNGHTQMR